MSSKHISVYDRDTDELIACGKVISEKSSDTVHFDMGLMSFDYKYYFNPASPRLRIERDDSRTDVKQYEENDKYTMVLREDSYRYDPSTVDIYRGWGLDELDPEVDGLVKAMNDIPGIEATGSCCGHGTRPLWVQFKVKGLEGLARLCEPILRDERFNGKMAISTGLPELPTYKVGFEGEINYNQTYLCISTYAKGQEAYDIAEEYAKYLSVEAPSGTDTKAVYTKDKWEFNKDVADCFEDMLKRSIPQYDVMREATFNIIKEHISPKSSVLDVGCSNGLSLDRLVRTYPDCTFTGLDSSRPMTEKASLRFENYPNVSIQCMDVTKGLQKGQYDVIICSLTLMFIPIQSRQQVIRDIYSHLNGGGLLVITEKVLGDTPDIDDLFVELYYDFKRSQGYTDEQIDAKRNALIGVQVPLKTSWNIDMLEKAGFKDIELFWKWMNFEGYVAVK